MAPYMLMALYTMACALRAMLLYYAAIYFAAAEFDYAFAYLYALLMILRFADDGFLICFLD